MRNPKNYWNEKTILKELSGIIADTGKFPLYKELLNLDKGGLINAIRAYGGMSKCRKILGFDLIRRDTGYWRDWANFEKEIRDAFPDMINHGVFPSRNQLRATFTALGRVISYFGGIKKVAERMNCKTDCLIAPDGHLVNSRSEFITDVFLWKNNIPHQVNGIINPERAYRYDFLIGDLFVEIWGLTNNKEYVKTKNDKVKFYNKLGLNLLNINKNTFECKLDNTYEKLEKLFAEHGVVALSSKIDVEISNACKNIGYWTYENTINAVKDFIKEYNQFPTYEMLCKTGNSGLHAAIHKHGGLYYFRNVLGMRKPYQLV